MWRYFRQKQTGCHKLTLLKRMKQLNVLHLITHLPEGTDDSD